MTTTGTRNRIMEAFRKQLAANGYPGISLTAVAEEAGIRKASLYHHFPRGKDELYAAVTRGFVQAQRARLTAALAAGGDLRARLVRLADAAADPSGEVVSFEQRLFDALPFVDEETRDAVSEEYVEGVLRPVVPLFREAVESGELTGADPEFLMNAFFHLARVSDMRPAGEPTAELVADLFLDGARARND